MPSEGLSQEEVRSGPPYSKEVDLLQLSIGHGDGLFPEQSRETSQFRGHEPGDSQGPVPSLGRQSLMSTLDHSGPGACFSVYLAFQEPSCCQPPSWLGCSLYHLEPGYSCPPSLPSGPGGPIGTQLPQASSRFDGQNTLPC